MRGIHEAPGHAADFSEGTGRFRYKFGYLASMLTRRVNTG